jgi:hypothetical protein
VPVDETLGVTPSALWVQAAGASTVAVQSPSPARGSHPFLPVHRIAAAVETGDDGQRFVSLDHEHKRVGKAAEQGAAHTLVNHRELGGVALMRSTTVSTAARKRRPKPEASFSYQRCASISSARARWVKGNRKYYGQRCSSSAFKAAQVMPSRRSWSSVARRLSSSVRCAVVRGSWSPSKLSQSCEIKVRRSGGVRRASSSWVSNSMHRA